MKISISKTHTETEQVNISVPAFWKNPSIAYNEYVAIIDENTVFNVLLMNDMSYIKSGTPEKMERSITEAHRDFNLTTEEDFMSAHDEALQGMSLKPVIKSYEQQVRDLIKETNGKDLVETPTSNAWRTAL